MVAFHIAILPDGRESRDRTGRIVIDPFDGDLDRRVELFVGQGGGLVDHLADEPDEGHHRLQQIHRHHLPAGREPQASRRMEVHVARSLELEAGRAPTPGGGRQAVGSPERPCERLADE